MSKGKAAIIAFSALYLTQPCFSAFTTTPDNLREGLMGQVSALKTEFIRKETTIKEGEGKQKRGAKAPITQEAPEKAPRAVQRTNTL